MRVKAFSHQAGIFAQNIRTEVYEDWFYGFLGMYAHCCETIVRGKKYSQLRSVWWISIFYQNKSFFSADAGVKMGENLIDLVSRHPIWLPQEGELSPEEKSYRINWQTEFEFSVSGSLVAQCFTKSVTTCVCWPAGAEQLSQVSRAF